mmetsp:Transcript_31475/g.54577  ORF Transcript_31475/g.54577 Transcript_31475/m.54577 type:complete len:231 (+) Transcript_31475:56-748(+)
MEAQSLIIVLDAHPAHWLEEAKSHFQSSSRRMSLDYVWSALMAYSNALIIQNSANKITWFIATDFHSANAFPSTKLRIVVGSLWKTVSMALAYLHKLKLSARLLVVQKHAYPHEYQLALHCIVAAHNLKATIDGLALTDSEVLSQACSFTGGTYIRQSHSGVLQTLLQVFLQPKKFKQSNIFNMRPKCTCCNREVEKAYVCSTCLAIYCEVSSECARCQSNFLFVEFSTD